MNIHSSLRRLAPAAVCALALAATASAASAQASGGGCPAGLSGTFSGGKVHYTLKGKLNQAFGTLPAGAPFTAKLVYAYPQTSTSTGPNGHYASFKIKVSFGNQTVSDSGPGAIDVYDKPTAYPTDLLVAYSMTPISGTLGGLTLATGAGLSVDLQNLAGTAWTTTALPNASRTMAHMTAGNATFIELRSTTGLIVRGNLCP